MTKSGIELSIIAPCFNEQDNIEELARRVDSIRPSLGVPVELVLVDDGSRDDTWLAIQRARRIYPFIVPVRHVGNAGIVAGWKSGLSASSGAYVVTIDADLQYRPSDIVALLERIRQGDADLVQGARTQEVQRSALRRWITASFSILLNLMFGMSLKDNKSGFILYRRAVMNDVLSTSGGFIYFQHFIAVAAQAIGYRIAEVPIVFDPRHAGQSFITNPLRMSLRALRDLPRAIARFRFGRDRRIS